MCTEYDQSGKELKRDGELEKMKIFTHQKEENTTPFMRKRGGIFSGDIGQKMVVLREKERIRQHE